MCCVCAFDHFFFCCGSISFVLTGHSEMAESNFSVERRCGQRELFMKRYQCHYVPEMMKATKTYIFMYREKGSSAPWHQAKQQIIIGQTTAHDKKKRKRIHQLQICIACVSHVSYEMLCVNTCRTRYSAERQSTGNGKRYLYLIASYIIHLIQLIPTRARCPQRLHGVKRWSFS